VENVQNIENNEKQQQKPTPIAAPNKPITPDKSAIPNSKITNLFGDKPVTEVIDIAKTDRKKLVEPVIKDAPNTPGKKSPEKNVSDNKTTNPEKVEKSVTAPKSTMEKPEKALAPLKQEKTVSTADKKENDISSKGDTAKPTVTKEITLKSVPSVPIAEPPEAEQSPKPKEAPRSKETEQVVFLRHTELHAPKNHPFGVRDDAEMKALIESVRDNGVNQPALVRPRIEGGYEIVCGNRRDYASKLAGFFEMPCIVREMTDEEAVLTMTDDNLRQRSEILPSEKAKSLLMQYEAIKHQGSRFKDVAQGDIGKRSIDLVGERNNMNSRQVQRYIRLNLLVPDMIKAVDENRLGFTSAVEISFINHKNQNLIAVSMDGNSSPSLSQAQRMREMDQKKQLNGDVIDAILGELKKEEIKVIITSAELDKYFGKDKTPREMKDQIIKLLDDWNGKEKTLNTPEKKAPDRS